MKETKNKRKSSTVSNNRKTDVQPLPSVDAQDAVPSGSNSATDLVHEPVSSNATQNLNHMDVDVDGGDVNGVLNCAELEGDGTLGVVDENGVAAEGKNNTNVGAKDKGKGKEKVKMEVDGDGLGAVALGEAVGEGDLDEAVVKGTGLMDLSNEVLLMIFCELDFKGAKNWTLTNKRLYTVGRDPYSLSMYFCNRFGKREAIFHAIAQGKVITPEVIDILVTSGANLSRYLMQILTQTYMRGSVHFLKGQYRGHWGTQPHLPPTIYSHLLSVSISVFKDDISLLKNEDDGAVWSRWFDRRRVEAELDPSIGGGGVARTGGAGAARIGNNNPNSAVAIARAELEEEKKKEWSKIEKLFIQYKFIPFSEKDPILTDLPRAIAFEPQLLPLAKANGFRLDAKYQNFVMRKQFKPASRFLTTSIEIFNGVKTYLDLKVGFYISVNVASEVLNDAEDYPEAYTALKQLQEHLLFDLAEVARYVILSRYRSRKLQNSPKLAQIIFKDFASKITDPVVHGIVLACVFRDLFDLPAIRLAMTNSENRSHGLPEIERQQVPSQFDVKVLAEALGINLTRESMVDCLCTDLLFAPDRPLAYYAQFNSTDDDIFTVVDEAARRMVRCPTKGHMLLLLVNNYPHLKKIISDALLAHDVDLSLLKEEEPSCSGWNSRPKFLTPIAPDLQVLEYRWRDDFEVGRWQEGFYSSEQALTSSDPLDLRTPWYRDGQHLGVLSTNNLSQGLSDDEHSLYPSRHHAPRRSHEASDTTTRLLKNGIPLAPCFLDWIDLKSPALQIVLLHALLNHSQIAKTYVEEGVPLTMRHVHALAQTGTNYCKVWDWIRQLPYYPDNGSFVDLSVEPVNPAPLPASGGGSRKAKRKGKGKARRQDEVNPSPVKRPRRSLEPKRYIEPDSDEDFEDTGETGLPSGEQANTDCASGKKRKRGSKKEPETEKSKWISALSELLKQENNKVVEKRRVAMEQTGKASRVSKTEFHKALIVELRKLRELDSLHLFNTSGSPPPLKPQVSHHHKATAVFGKVVTAGDDLNGNFDWESGALRELVE